MGWVIGSYRKSPMSGCILIVDDDELLADSLALTVEAMLGLRSMVVRNGASALRVARDPRVSVRALITDLQLPQLDGFELIRQMRALPGYAGLPALMITAAGEECRNGCTVEGPNLILHKPFSYREVSRVLETLLL
jgi:DNA-binding response OmpR family regulator